MTGLENILKQIEDDAKCRVDEIKASADSEAKAILDNAAKEAQSILENYDAMAVSKSKITAERAAVADESDAKRAVLRKKQELIKKVMDSAYKEIKESDSDVYFRFLENILKKNVQKGEGKILLAEDDIKEITSGFKTLLDNNSLKAESANIEKRNGFVLVYGSIEINCTVNALFDEKTEELSDSLNSFLFGSEGGK